MDTQKLSRIRQAIRLVDQRAKEAVIAAREDRVKAYRLLQYWSKDDAVLSDALTSVGLLLSMKDDLVIQGNFERASSIETLIDISQTSGSPDDTLPSMKVAGVIGVKS